jgi:hypothetical protein
LKQVVERSKLPPPQKFEGITENQTEYIKHVLPERHPVRHFGVLNTKELEEADGSYSPFFFFIAP